MSKQSENNHLKRIQCVLATVPVWGLVQNNHFVHLSFDPGQYGAAGADSVAVSMSIAEQEKWCAMLVGLLQGKTLPFPAEAATIGAGSLFQQRVWRAISTIPWAETRTYGALAGQLGNPGLARAVGQACNRNPLPIIIPCHRVVAAAGPGGFAGGKAAKVALLNYERQWRARSDQQWPG